MQNHKTGWHIYPMVKISPIRKNVAWFMCWKRKPAKICWQKKKSKNPVSVNMNITLSFMQKEDMHYLLCAGYSSKIFMYLFISTSQLYQVSIIIIIFSYIRENWGKDCLRSLPVNQPVTGSDRIWLQAIICSILQFLNHHITLYCLLMTM